MKRWMMLFSCLLTFMLPTTPPQAMLEHSHSVAPSAFGPEDEQYLDPRGINTQYLSVRAMQLQGFDAQSMLKLEQAFQVLELVVNTEEFKDRVINFKNSKGLRLFASNNGKSNEEVYEQFMEGRELLQPQTSGEMNFFLKLYYNRWSKVVGWTSPKTNVININWKFFKTYAAYEVAGNLAHEWVHKLGFDHRSAAEHDSVPYAIGYIVEEMAQRYLVRQQQLH
jgi:hypothetical protein